MTHEYEVSGITCEGCVSKVKSLLEKIPGVTNARVGLDGKVSISMQHHIATNTFQEALRDHPKYKFVEINTQMEHRSAAKEEPAPGFWKTYKPILLVFGYIMSTTLAVEVIAESFDWMRWMRYFMAGFFLVFSFFKLLDVPAFATSYSSYDVLARRWLGWGYAYPFVELTLGIMFLINFNPLITNSLTLGIMTLSTVGVVQSLMAKRRFQCACLGTVFNLPMSNITLIEDSLMVAMSGVMLMLQLGAGNF